MIVEDICSVWGSGVLWVLLYVSVSLFWSVSYVSGCVFCCYFVSFANYTLDVGYVSGGLCLLVGHGLCQCTYGL
jgi:hypothetical protein